MLGNVIAIQQRKGGGGKSTLTVNLAGELVKRGYKVLIIDIDPQGHAGSKLGLRKKKTQHLSPEQTSYQLLVEGKPIGPIPVKFDDLEIHVITANRHLTDVGTKLAALSGKGLTNFNKTIQVYKKHYDFILIDTPGVLNQVNLAVCFASDFALIPTFVDNDSVDETLETIDFIKGSGITSPDEAPKILGIVVTRYDQNTRAFNDFASRVKGEVFTTHPDVRVFPTMIASRTLVPQSNNDGFPLALYPEKGKATKEYELLTDNILAKLGITTDGKKTTE